MSCFNLYELLEVWLTIYLELIFLILFLYFFYAFIILQHNFTFLAIVSFGSEFTLSSFSGGIGDKSSSSSSSFKGSLMQSNTEENKPNNKDQKIDLKKNSCACYSL